MFFGSEKELDEKIFIDKDQPKNASARVFIFTLGIAQICSWGTLYYSFPQIALAVEMEFAWSKSVIYGALTLGLLLSSVSSIPVGMAIDKGYGRLIMALGSVMAGLLLIAGAYIHSLFWFYLVFSSIGFLHSATLYDAAFSVIANYFGPLESKQHITSLTLLGGFAGTLFIPLIEFMLTQMNWREVLMILGAINILICSGIYLSLPKKLNGNQAHDSKNNTSYQGVRWALQQPMFWLLLITLTLFTSLTSAFIFHLYPMLLEKGITASQVISIIAVIGPSQVAGRLMLMLFSSRLNTSRLAIFISMVISGVLAGFLFLPTAFWLMAVLAALLGASIGVMTIIKGIAVPEFLTEHAYGAINGVMNVPIKIVSAFAPAIAALLWSVNNSYDLVLLSLIGLGVVIGGLFVFIHQFKHSNSRTG